MPIVRAVACEGTLAMKRILLLACAAMLAGCAKKEPVFKGKTADQWHLGISDQDLQVRRDAVNALGALKDASAVPDLITALKDKDDQVRARAAESLWSIGAKAKEAIPALTFALKDKKTDVRLSAAGALGEMAPEAETAIPS